MIIGLFFFIGQLLEFCADMWEIPSALIRSISSFFYTASGINNVNSGQDDGQD